MTSNRFRHIMVSLCCCLLMAVDVSAYNMTQLKNVHIELHYDLPKQENEVGVSHTKSIVPYTYFMLNDIYTDEEKKVKSDSYKDAVTAFDFDLNYPLYDYIISGGNVKIPFYVEPGDTLIINLTKAGKVTSYAKKNGEAYEYSNLLFHDFSNNVLYTEKMFDEDKKDANFTLFVQRITKRMNHSLDSLKLVADKYNFNDKERLIAQNNIKIQYAIWMFRYAPFKSGKSSNYSGGNTSVGQAEDIADAKNYAFIKNLPMDDSTCVASRYFSRFMSSYEHTYILNSDKHLYDGTTLQDQARMDSAFIAKDMLITGLEYPSFFMAMAMIRRHFDPSSIDDGSVRLHEVKVIGHQNSVYKPVTPEDMIKWRQEQKPTIAEQISSPSYWIFERKKYRNRQRAQALIDKIAAEDDAKNSERDALLKAYEEETGHKYEEGK